ncbi:MAG: ABC transporter ATP-binding protein [Anaerolineaceae bacterium]|nr:ABC transporter ATP-binding protein [Anaerolineaceae bacterium]
MKKLLEIKDLHVSYGGIQALKGISLEVDEGEIISIIGANGAGKSTMLNALSRLIKVEKGEISFDGSPLPTQAYQVVKSGIVQVPEGRQIFANLTVRGNLEIGAYLRKDKDGIAKDVEYIFSVFPRLQERQSQYGGSLSGGEQQMLAIGRGLLAKPKLMLLDEPSLGLAPMLVEEIFNVIKKINSEGTTILLVEQNADKALSIAHRGYVLETGKIIKTGHGKELLNDPKVQEAYLGTKIK